MSNPLDIIRIAEGADRLLRDEAATAAIASLMEEIHQEWAHSNPADKEGREDLFQLGRAVQLFVAKLKSLKDRGTVEVHKSEQARKAQASSIH